MPVTEVVRPEASIVVNEREGSYLIGGIVGQLLHSKTVYSEPELTWREDRQNRWLP